MEMMGASDWRERHKGIDLFRETAENNVGAINQQIISVSETSLDKSHKHQFRFKDDRKGPK